MKIYLLTLSVLVAACSAKRTRQFPEYQLTKSDAFIVSASPELWHYFSHGDRDPKDLKVDFLARNISQSEQALLLEKATITANNETSSLDCKDLDKQKILNVGPGVTVRITCAVTLIPNEKNQLAMKDTFVKVDIPTGKSALHIEKLFRIEEFNK